MSERTQRLHEICKEAAKKGRIVITGHDRADVDSAAGCVLIARLLERWDVESSIVPAAARDRSCPSSVAMIQGTLLSKKSSRKSPISGNLFYYRRESLPAQAIRGKFFKFDKIAPCAQ